MFGINTDYASVILKPQYDAIERYALYLIAQCIAYNFIDIKKYFLGGIPVLDQCLVDELEDMLL